MKRHFSILLFTIFAFSNAQVSMITSGFSQNLSKSDINFSGDRKLFAIGINDKNSENFYVISKNKAGADSDELYLEKFTKKGENYLRSFSYKMDHSINKSLAFIDNRASYSDVDKDGNYESISIVDAYENGPESKLEKVYGIIQYKNEAFVVSVSAKDGFVENDFSENFNRLPKQISDHFLQFWNGLKKQ